MQTTKLYIYIPTYNREREIFAQLGVLYDQVEKYKDKVRVIVNDNGSDQGYYQELKRKYPHDNIQYNQNFGNIEGNANIIQGFIHAKKDEFIWLLSDDELLNHNSLEYIIKNIDESSDIVLFEKNTRVNNKLIYNFDDQTMDPIDWGQGLISAVLIKSNLIQKYLSAGYYYHNSSFPHLAVFLAAARETKDIKYQFMEMDKVFFLYEAKRVRYDAYSIASTGMPWLVDLMHQNNQKRFIHGWTHRNGWRMMAFRKKHPECYVYSRYLIVKYGGVWGYILLIKSWLISLIYPQLLLIKEKIYQSEDEKKIKFYKKLARAVGWN